jgi:hypothetical protein
MINQDIRNLLIIKFTPNPQIFLLRGSWIATWSKKMKTFSWLMDQTFNRSSLGTKVQIRHSIALDCISSKTCRDRSLFADYINALIQHQKARSAASQFLTSRSFSCIQQFIPESSLTSVLAVRKSFPSRGMPIVTSSLCIIRNHYK